MAMVMMGVQQHSGGAIFFDRNGMLTPKDQYPFRWVETTNQINQKVWGTLRDAMASLGLHWTWPEFERSAV